MSQELSAAQRHAAARYVGMPLFAAGAAGFAYALFAWLTGGAPGNSVMLYMGATGLSLGTFGSHNDTAIAYMQRVERAALPEGMAAELQGELERDREETQDLSPSPRLAWGITVVALLLHAAAAYRVFA